MDTASALALVEARHGSLESLALHILDEKKEALDESVPLTRRADMLGLPAVVFARILASAEFRALLRASLVNTNFGVASEEKHIKHMVGVATGDRRLVMNSKGDLARVDQAPGDVIAAGKYLNEMRGTAIESRQTQLGGVTLNFHFAEPDNDAPKTIEIEAEVHRPSRAGDLPPAGVVGRFASPVANAASADPALDVGVAALYREGPEDSESLAQARAPGRLVRRKGYISRAPATVSLRHTLADLRERPSYDDSGFATEDEGEAEAGERRNKMERMHDLLRERLSRG